MWFRSALKFESRCRNSNISAPYSCPSSRLKSHVYVQKIWARIDANAARAEFWNEFRPVVLLLERKSLDLDVRGDTLARRSHRLRVIVRQDAEVLGVGRTADELVVFRAAAGVVDDDRFRALLAQLLKRCDQDDGDDAEAAVWTGQFFLREMRRQQSVGTA